MVIFAILVFVYVFSVQMSSAITLQQELTQLSDQLKVLEQNLENIQKSAPPKGPSLVPLLDKSKVAATDYLIKANDDKVVQISADTMQKIGTFQDLIAEGQLQSAGINKDVVIDLSTVPIDSNTLFILAGLADAVVPALYLQDLKKRGYITENSVVNLLQAADYLDLEKGKLYQLAQLTIDLFVLTDEKLKKTPNKYEAGIEWVKKIIKNDPTAQKFVNIDHPAYGFALEDFDQSVRDGFLKKIEDGKYRLSGPFNSLKGIEKLTDKYRVHELYIENIRLKTLPKDAFKGFSLCTLSLKNVGLEKIEEGAFGIVKENTYTGPFICRRLNAQKMLDLSYNKLKALPQKLFSKDYYPRIINLSNNDLEPKGIPADLQNKETAPLFEVIVLAGNPKLSNKAIAEIAKNLGMKFDQNQRILFRE